MPFLDLDQIIQLTGDRTSADSELNLGNLSAAEALPLLAEALEARRPAGGSMIVRFRPAMPGGGETLFLPVGRYLLEEKRAGRLSRVAHLLEVGAGFYVEF